MIQPASSLTYFRQLADNIALLQQFDCLFLDFRSKTMEATNIL